MESMSRAPEGDASGSHVATDAERIVLRAQNLDRAGFAHGFSLRFMTRDGSSDELDFGPTRSPEARAANVRALAHAVGFSPDDLRQVDQVHGARVVSAASCMSEKREAADAIVADAESGPHVVGVRVADCVPILIGDRRIGAVAAIHAGWRGVVAGVVAAALSELAKIGSGDYVAAIGPCIGPCCFEVDTSIGDEIARAANDASVIAKTNGAKCLVDLRRAVRAQLKALRVLDVEDVPDSVSGCTKCDAARFHSYRRDAEKSGRHIAVIAARTRAPISHGSIRIDGAT